MARASATRMQGQDDGIELAFVHVLGCKAKTMELALVHT